MKIAAIVQARVGSTRLSQKVFKKICGKSLIWHVINRLKYSKKIDEIILAIPLGSKDDILENWAIENKITCYRGSEKDVLGRFYSAAKENNVDIIVRITSDDPFKDFLIIDEVIGLFEKEKLDFAYNNKPPTFPEGLDVEVFSFSSLELANIQANEYYEREHVTPYFYKNQDLFKQKCLKYSNDISYLRWTIDTQEDLDMVKIIYEALFYAKKNFTMLDILNFLEKNTDIAKMNSNVVRSDMYKK